MAPEIEFERMGFEVTRIEKIDDSYPLFIYRIPWNLYGE
jgi:hypothetical protein